MKPNLVPQIDSLTPPLYDESVAVPKLLANGAADVQPRLSASVVAERRLGGAVDSAARLSGFVVVAAM